MNELLGCVAGVLCTICIVLPIFLFISNIDEKRNKKQWAAIILFMGPVGWVLGPIICGIYWVGTGMNWVIKELR